VRLTGLFAYKYGLVIPPMNHILYQSPNQRWSHFSQGVCLCAVFPDLSAHAGSVTYRESDGSAENKKAA